MNEIIKEGVIATHEKCKKFDKLLVYAFYGRPAFRNSSNESVRYSARAPMAILLKASVEKFASAIFPFDSGAYLDGRYDHWLASGMRIDDFSLQADPRRARRFVRAFYGSNEAYWRMKYSAPPGNHCGRPAVQALCEILGDKSISAADDRRLAIEMSLTSPVPFTSEFVDSLIVPEEYADFLDEIKLTEQTGISVNPYILNPLRTAAAHLEPIETEAKAINASRRAFI